MTISSTVRKAGPYAGNGVAVQFAFGFKVFSGADIRLIKTDAEGAESPVIGAVITPSADQEASPGGTVTLAAPLPTGWRLTIVGNLPMVQPLELTNHGGFYPRTLNDAFDRLTILAQQQAEELARSLKFQASDDAASTEMPQKSARAGRVLAFDTGTGAPVAGPTIAEVGTVGAAVAAISAVAGDLANIDIVAANVGSVVTASANMAAIIDAPNRAAAAASSASAAQSSESAAQSSATAAQSSALAAANARSLAQSSAISASFDKSSASNYATAAAASAADAQSSSEGLGLVGMYGVSFDEARGTVRPLGSATAHLTLPIQSRMRRCLLGADGSVLTYLYENNSGYTANGTFANIDGSGGQVMVEVPKFWFRYERIGSEHCWWISERARTNFSVHPDFIKDGVEVPFRYVGAFEGRVDGGLLGSVSGVYPSTGRTRAQFRAAAVARGAGWRCMTYTQWNAIALLALVEFKTFNIRDTLVTAGRSNLSGGSFIEGSYLALTGLSKVRGNHSGGVALGSSAGILTDYNCYRGVENPFGSTAQMLDGINIDSTAASTSAPLPVWTTNNKNYFADATSTNMVLLGAMPNLGAYSDEVFLSSLVPHLGSGFWPSPPVVGSMAANVFVSIQGAASGGWRLLAAGYFAGAECYSDFFSLDQSRVTSSAENFMGARLSF